MHALAAALRRAAEHLGRALAALFERRKVLDAVQHLAGDLDPVVHEHRLHLRHDRAFRAEVRVAPVLGILGVARPDVGDADAAGEAHLAVDDQHLAMRAIVHSGQVIPGGLVKLPHVDARASPSSPAASASSLLLPSQSSSRCTFTPARARSESASANSWPIVPGPVDVALEGDRLLRPADRGEHRREDLVAVQQDFEAIALDDGGTQQHAHRPTELGIPRVVEASDRLLDLLLARLEHEHDKAGGERGADGNGCHNDVPSVRTTSAAELDRDHIPRGRRTYVRNEQTRAGTEVIPA